MECRSLVIQRQCVTSTLYSGIEYPVRQFERPDPPAYSAGHFIDRKPVSGDRVPKPEKADAVDRPVIGGCGRRWRCIVAVEYLPPDGVIFSAVIVFVCGSRQPIQIDLIVGLDEALVENEAYHHSNGEGAAAKAKPKYLVFVAPVIPADEFVDVDDIPFQAVAESAPKHRERFEAGSAHAIIVEGHLIRTGQIDRIK